MKLISHRGNLSGPMKSWENEPTYIDLALQSGYDVEVDVWYKNNMLWLGHDKPDYGVNLDWFKFRISQLWIHCKNIEAVIYFQECNHNFNYFWHQEDALTLTSHGYMWVYPGKQPVRGSIAVMPELGQESVLGCIGVCSDFIKNYKK